MNGLLCRAYRAERVELPRHNVKRVQSLLKKFPNHADRQARLSIEGRVQYTLAAKNQHNLRGYNHD
jgi:hypothetical protein